MADFAVWRAQRSGAAFAGRFEKPGGRLRYRWASGGLQREGAQSRTRGTRFDGRNGLLQDQAEHEKRGRALLLSRCGLVPRTKTGDSNHDSRRTARVRVVLWRLRAGERDLLSVRCRAGAKRQLFAGAVLRRKNRAKHTTGRCALLDAGVQTGDENAVGREVIFEARTGIEHDVLSKLHGWNYAQGPLLLLYC